jgi:hypothetical protein
MSLRVIVANLLARCDRDDTENYETFHNVNQSNDKAIVGILGYLVYIVSYIWECRWSRAFVNILQGQELITTGKRARETRVKQNFMVEIYEAANEGDIGDFQMLRVVV